MTRAQRAREALEACQNRRSVAMLAMLEDADELDRDMVQSLGLHSLDSGRLIRAMESVLALADQYDTIPANTLYNAVMTALESSEVRV